MLALGAEENPADALEYPLTIELGNLYENEVVSRDVRIKNKSSGVVHIDAIGSTCACAVVAAEKEFKLEPGEARRIGVTVSFGERNGETSGNLYTTWRHGNGAARESTISLRGKVVSQAILDARQLDFERIDGDGGVRVLIVSVRPGADKQAWDTVESLSSEAAIEAQSKQGPGNQWKITVVLNPKLFPISQIRKPVRLFFSKNGTRLPGYIEVPVTAKITGAITVRPQLVYFGKIPPNAKAERLVYVTSATQPLHRTTARSNSRSIELVRIDSSERKATFRVTLTAPSEAGPFGEKFSIFAEDGTEAELAVLATVQPTPEP